MGQCWWRCSIILLFLNCNPAPVTCLLVTHWSPLFSSGDCLQATAPHTMQNYFTPTALSWPIRERLMGVCRPRYLAATGSSAGDGETTALWRRRWEGWKKNQSSECSLQPRRCGRGWSGVSGQSWLTLQRHCGELTVRSSLLLLLLQNRHSQDSSLHTTLCCVLDVWF